MMHWRAEPVPSPARSKDSKRSKPAAAPRPAAAGGQAFVIRCLAMAVAALLTANGVIVTEQVTGRDLITLSSDGLSNARQAIADLLGDKKDNGAVVAGAVTEKPTTTTTPAPAAAGDTTTTTAPAAAPATPATPAPAAGATTSSSAPAKTTTTTARKAPAAAAAATDWNHVADTIRPYIEKETSLSFTGPLKVTALETDPFNQRLNAVRMVPALDRARKAEGTLKALGIIEPNVDLAAQVQRLSTGSVTAFYDVKANELVIHNGPLTPFMLKSIVHEMVRADYDQHFELDRPSLVAPDDETGVAWDSLVEGTASRIEARFVSALPDADKKAVQADQQRIAAQLPKDLPDYVLVEYAFPFGSGPKFADYLMTNGGPARVNAAFQKPPTTTEQIIHPEKFVAGEGPKALANPTADGAAIRSGSLGQLMISLMLAQAVDPGQAETAADGWGADRYVTWMNGNQTCVRLAIDMDTPAQVTAMGQALAEWAKNTPGATVSGSGPYTVTRCV